MKLTLRSDITPTTLEELGDILLANRGVSDPESFFSPPHPSTFQPSGLGLDDARLATAANRLKQAIKENERVLIYGDYDADGITATAILWKTLNHLGLQAIPFIPSRQKHGYGISQRSLEDILEHQPDLIVTVDNGIVAHDIFIQLKKLGIQTILTDHHQPESKNGQALYPPADVIVHSTKLCGATVAWMLARSLDAGYAETLLGLCALATIADQMPLKEHHRAFVYHGLAQLRVSKDPWITELCRVAETKQDALTSGSIGYQIAPRINAMGRIAHGMDALRLLCTHQGTTAQKYAAILQETNLERQELTTEMLEIGKAQAEQQAGEHLLVVSSQHFHEGVIGLVAGKLTELYHTPTLAIAVGTDTAKGSARSIQGIDITQILRAHREHLLEVGGHPMAGGFLLETTQLEPFITAVQKDAKESISAELLEPSMRVDCSLPTALVQIETAQMLADFEPFGTANPRPTFVLENMQVEQVQRIGSEQQHYKLTLQQKDNVSGEPVTALWWNGVAEQEIHTGGMLNIVGKLEISEFRGVKRVQVVVKDCVKTI
ncbi:MAG: single-stranded-DNA-specific exonuclease RecJ [Pseudomonadales bacterium]|nr:single-stranded-DNA-specific exonuclease RecJ [Candidatus Woesebacteria bacterium]MCB9802133.1 single-stranded-DNA-specific exonuclease RecJ [Pseudomonadales bacterium]